MSDSEPISSQEPTKKELLDEVARLERDMELLEDPQTIFSFGQMAFDGDGVEQDYQSAANWFRIAAEMSHAKSQHNLALMLEDGLGASVDIDEAAKWYRLAADQGLASSQNNLGSLYETGRGVQRDYVLALFYYEQAVQGGDINAISNSERLRLLVVSN